MSVQGLLWESMAKRKPTDDSQSPVATREILAAATSRRRRALVLRRYLADEADKVIYRDERQDRAHQILIKWADLEREGHLQKKETALDASFLLEVFGEALGYKPATVSPEAYQLERNFTVPDLGTADGALGQFATGATPRPVAVIELKGAAADLDRDRFGGRTPVQQCWDYLNALPDCPWGIVSNYRTIRLYHRAKTPLAYEEFHLHELRVRQRFNELYCLLEAGGLLPSRLGEPRALRLLTQTDDRQREVGGELYAAYSDNRYRLIEHLHHQRDKTLEESIHIAQKILDRIVFIAFCEDRGLLPERCIEQAHRALPPFSKVTNPRWQNFLNLFRAVDKGDSRDLMLERGYNGGLFHHDPAVDDLDLDDAWTNFFQGIGTYDFRDEVNVDVLGHIFEQSITDLNRLRVGGLFGQPKATETVRTAPKDDRASAMPKSPQRKRTGTDYTPPEFTRLIVERTVGALMDERLDALRERHGLSTEDLEATQPTQRTGDYWREALDVMRAVKVCDPACGSGAFLIVAYDHLEDRYLRVVHRIAAHEGDAAEGLAESVPDLILRDNLYGVDLSQQAVEITQLALWIRSARRGKTLADLSQNVVCGNSLVTDPAVDPRAMNWSNVFDSVFSRKDQPGFDCVIGNPPWERLKLQEREFFAHSARKIAEAVSAADRRRRIARLETANAELFALYNEAKTSAEHTLAHVREEGNFPLTGKGDVNTYMLFAELARRIVAPSGRVGLLVPSGIATDATTKDFFAALVDSEALAALYDFENKAAFFPDVHRSFKFSVLLFRGGEARPTAADFVFFARRMEDLDEKRRHIRLTAADFALFNPNTHTCPIFRSRRDADLTKKVYRRVPILVDRTRRKGGNSWGLKFVTMFHQTNDAELFHTREQLKELGLKQRDNVWTKGKRKFLPLYEAKMVQAYDHRAASVVVDEANWMRQGQTSETSLVAHQNPEFVVQPRWWVEEKEVARVIGESHRGWFIGFKDITSPTNQRTMIASAIPYSAVTNHFPLLLTAQSPRFEACLLANLNAFALDYVTRQKIGGVTLNFFIVEQLPIFAPDFYTERCPWNKRQTLEKWISDRVLKLTCTADDMRPLAEAASFDPPVHKWNPNERADLTAELDAAYFVLYGMARDDVEYVLSTFRGIGARDKLLPGMGSTSEQILAAYDKLVEKS